MVNVRGQGSRGQVNRDVAFKYMYLIDPKKNPHPLEKQSHDQAQTDETLSS